MAVSLAAVALAKAASPQLQKGELETALLGFKPGPRSKKQAAESNPQW
jgi:hypothetical protein